MRRRSQSNLGLWNSIFLALLFCDLIAVTWYLWAIPETEFERWKRVISTVAGWAGSVLGFFGLKRVAGDRSLGEFLDMAGVRIGIFVGTILIWLFIVPFHSLSFGIQEAGGQPLADVTASVDQLQNSTSDHGGGVSFRGLLASPHRVQLAKKNYESVDWKSGFADVLPWASPHRVVLERAQGVVRLRSTPDGAEILLDGDSGKTFGTTPHDLTLTAGDHSVLFRKANYSDSKWEPILVPPRGVVDFDRPLQKIVDSRTYPLTVASEPPEAEIYIDEHFRGITPVELKVGRGSHLVRVTKDGTTRRDNVSVPERSIVVFELSKK